MWGRFCCQGNPGIPARFIPTHVGQIIHGMGILYPASVHPHACGADDSDIAERLCTPVHPHACGADYVCRSHKSCNAGSSPRVWGRSCVIRSMPSAMRFIPTRVGQIMITLRQSINTKSTRTKEENKSRSAHDISKDTMLQLKDAVLHPVAIIRNSRGTIIVTDLLDSEKSPIILPLSRKKIETNLSAMDAKSAYGKVIMPTLFGKFDNGKFVSDESATISIYKNNAIDLLSVSSEQYGAPKNINDVITRLSQKNGNVNENFSLRTDADSEARTQQAMDDLRQDAEFYAQAMSDKDVRAAVQAFATVMDSMQRMTGDNAVRGAWQERLDEYASQIITETGSKITKKELKEGMQRLFSLMDEGKVSTGDALMYAREMGMRVLEKAPEVHPHARGADLLLHPVLVGFGRFIPTHVGQIDIPYLDARHIAVHPHACGADVY